MNSGNSSSSPRVSEEISALFKTLRETEQRLEELTRREGAVVVDCHEMQPVLRHAQGQDEYTQSRSQVSVAQSEAGLHRAQIMAKLAHVVSGPDGSFEQWSENLPQLIGVDPAQMPRTTRAWLNILHPDDRTLFRDKAIEAGVNSLRVELEYRLRRTDGEWIHVRQAMEPLEEERDASLGMRWFNTLQDVTAERRIEESLRASELQFRQMAENIRDALFLQKLDRTQMYYVSPAYEEIWGKTCASLYANPSAWLDSVHPDDLDGVLANINGKGKSGFDREFRIVRPDGDVRWVHVRGFPIRNEAGKSYRLAAIASDITARKRDQETLHALNLELESRVRTRTNELDLARNEAERANRAKSAFLATMSHEIRTPMNGVIGMVDVLSSSQLSAQQADAVKTIRTSAFSLLALIDDILDFSKIEAGRMDLERSPVALTDLIESVCTTLLPVAADKDVKLSLFISPSVPAQVWADPTRLRQILFNLAGNAIKFSAGRPNRQGRVSVRVDCAAGSHSKIVLRFIDNGIGIAPEALSHLFSAFTQAEASTTRRFGGTGLGLAICKRLVTLMKGDIDVQSSLGEGTTFTVTLPAVLVDEGAERSGPDLSGVDCIVMGTEIEPADMRAYLEHAGARVHLVSDRDAAIERAIALKDPVLIQYSVRGGPSPDVLREAFASMPHVRHLLISHGRRKGARKTAPDVVILDADFLRCAPLLHAVAVAAGRCSPDAFQERDVAKPVAVAPPSIAEARAQGQLLLIAEDDEINKKVILRQIELLGYAAEIADNGADALRLWRAGDYALLLTDLNMPEMDGYVLAETIRREEAQSGWTKKGRMPILAFTANALRGEAVRAQAAGMDDYLTKPLQLHLLKAALAKWLPKSCATAIQGDGSEAPRAVQETPVIDITVLERLVGPEPEIVRELLAKYQASAAHMGNELRDARNANDLRQIGTIVHKLKSGSRSVGALPLGDLCAEVENACRTGSGEGISEGVTQIEAALRVIDEKINELLER